MNVAGIEYLEPEVMLLQDTGLGVAELAARTCYDSFDNSENDCIRTFHNGGVDTNIDLVNNIEHSDLLDNLAWTYFHHSILEHVNISYLIKGTSRGVLQEHARHRIQAISVRSTRYTMSSIINAYLSSLCEYDFEHRFNFFYSKINEMNMFVTKNSVYDIKFMYDKLDSQRRTVGTTTFVELCVAKSVLEKYSEYEDDSEEMFNYLQSSKKKRNVGDNVKHIVTDNWKVDMVVTFNLRSLKNYFELRDSGAAYFQIQMLSKAMKEVTPTKYLKLIDKSYKEK